MSAEEEAQRRRERLIAEYQLVGDMALAAMMAIGLFMVFAPWILLVLL